MPHARRTWFWRLRRASLLLLLGLGTTIAVAWTTEAWSPMRLIATDRLSAGGSSRAGLALWFVDVPAQHWPTAPEKGLVAGGIGRTVTTVWAGGFLMVAEGDAWTQQEVRVGFPLRSLRRVEVVNEPAVPADDALHLSLVQAGLPLPAWLIIDPTKDRRLPLLPLWPGLVGNTLFYALLWLLGFAHLRLVICNRRFRRGLCPACRYDLGFNNAPGCPECGWRRE